MSVDAPERIFIAPNRDYENIWGRPFVTHDFDEDGTEYVRIDKLEELAAALAEKDKALDEIIRRCSSFEHINLVGVKSSKEKRAGTLRNVLLIAQTARNAGGKDDK